MFGIFLLVYGVVKRHFEAGISKFIAETTKF
jgi:hypothetical protein